MFPGGSRSVARRGPTLLAVEHQIEALVDPDRALVAVARGLAQAFDVEPTAAVARELRATLQALRPAGDVDRQQATVLRIRGGLTAVGDAS